MQRVVVNVRIVCDNYCMYRPVTGSSTLAFVEQTDGRRAQLHTYDKFRKIGSLRERCIRASTHRARQGGLLLVTMESRSLEG